MWTYCIHGLVIIFYYLFLTLYKINKNHTIFLLLCTIQSTTQFLAEAAFIC